MHKHIWLKTVHGVHWILALKCRLLDEVVESLFQSRIKQVSAQKDGWTALCPGPCSPYKGGRRAPDGEKTDRCARDWFYTTKEDRQHRSGSCRTIPVWLSSSEASSWHWVQRTYLFRIRRKKERSVIQVYSQCNKMRCFTLWFHWFKEILRHLKERLGFIQEFLRSKL